LKSVIQVAKENFFMKPGIFIGGLPIEDDRTKLKVNKINILVGTFGRI
jgi:hypothetical protein